MEEGTSIKKEKNSTNIKNKIINKAIEKEILKQFPLPLPDQSNEREREREKESERMTSIQHDSSTQHDSFAPSAQSR